MAPEQWDNAKVDVRADVWGLGATLYELLTLRRPFAGMGRAELETAIRTARPMRPRTIIGNVPEDLAAICLKALEKKPALRYPTAQALADDLRHWLNREPPSVRRSVPRRLRLWSARNKGWAAAIVLALAALGGIVAAAVIRAKAANVRALDGERTTAVQTFQKQIQGEHSAGKDRSWRNEALNLVAKASQIRPDLDLRNDAVLALIGIDGRMTYEFNDVTATSVAIDAAGTHVLSGGGRSPHRRNGARLWVLATDQHDELRESGPGPVAFRAEDGAPLQLIANAGQPAQLELWNIASGKREREFKLPVESNPVFATTWTGDPLLALTADATWAAAAMRPGGDKNVLLVWNVKTGELVRRIERAGPNITAMAIDPKGEQVSAGFMDGQLVVWPVPDGDPQALPHADQAAVYALSFGRSPKQDRSPREKNRLLAVGADGGNVTVWDLARAIPQAYCHGSWYGVFTVAFSPDGMTLASAGRGPISLWDTATGRRLVTFDSADFITGLAFTADGTRLAASSIDVFGGEGGVRVWDLEMNRGIAALRGLTAPPANVCVAPLCDRVAALSHNWQIGVWNRKTGFLERILDGPQGITADNSALEFSPDGQRLFCSAGSEARLWDLTTGVEQKWMLPRGLQDTAAFSADGKNVFLYRAEADATGPVGRMRNLVGPRPEKAIWENRFFDNRTLNAVVSCDAAVVAVQGWRGSVHREEVCKLFRVATGEEVWSLSTRNPKETVNARIDPLGKFMAVSTPGGATADLLELPSCRLIDRMGRFPFCLSPGGAYGGALGDPGGFALFRRADESAVVTLGINVRATTMQMQFSVDGKLAAWGNVDGSVYIANIEEVRRQLATYGLNW